MGHLREDPALLPSAVPPGSSCAAQDNLRVRPCTAGGYENNPRGLLWFRSLFVTIVGFPIICATSVVMSFYLGCNGYHRSAVLVALLAPLVGIVTAVVLMAFDG